MEVLPFTLSYRAFLFVKQNRSSTTSTTMKFQGACIVPGCKSRPKTICSGCTRDVQDLVFVCQPTPDKHCWKILHQSRARNPVDVHGNPIERPNLTHKRRRNSSFGVERIPKRRRKSLYLNPHHVQ